MRNLLVAKRNVLRKTPIFFSKVDLTDAVILQLCNHDIINILCFLFYSILMIFRTNCCVEMSQPTQNIALSYFLLIVFPQCIILISFHSIVELMVLIVFFGGFLFHVRLADEKGGCKKAHIRSVSKTFFFFLPVEYQKYAHSKRLRKRPQMNFQLSPRIFCLSST